MRQNQRNLKIAVLLPFFLILFLMTGCDQGSEGQPASVLKSTEPEVIEPGQGSEIEEGSIVVIEYIGRLETGEVFDSSEKKQSPFCFTMGDRKVIEGLEKGLSGIEAGAKVTLTVPPHEAYGEQGLGTLIPPNATLTYDIEIVSVLPNQLIKDRSPFDTANLDTEREAIGDGISYVDLSSGFGAAVGPGDTAFLHYTCWARDGGQINSTIEQTARTESDKCTPLSVVFPRASANDTLVNTQNVEHGEILTTTEEMTKTNELETNPGVLEEVVQGMKVGGERLIIVESDTETANKLRTRLLCDEAELNSVLMTLTRVD